MKFKLDWTDATMGKPSEVFDGLQWKLERDDGEWKDYYLWAYFESKSIEEAKKYVKENRYDIANGRTGIEIFSCLVKVGRSWQPCFTEEDLEDIGEV